MAHNNNNVLWSGCCFTSSVTALAPVGEINLCPHPFLFTAELLSKGALLPFPSFHGSEKGRSELFLGF